MDYKETILMIESLKNPKNVAQMARFGIRSKTKVYGVPVPELRRMSRIIKKDHNLALKLWDSKIHEARVLAGMIADADKLTVEQTERWVKDFDSWDVCDQTCMNLLCRSKTANKQIAGFSKRKEEFVKRTAFALIAALAVHDKKMNNKDFVRFFPLIKKASNDERNFVKKAVNWALRQIGKRNKKLNAEAIKVAREILQLSKKVYPRVKVSAETYGAGAKWIANDAIRELTQKKF